MRRRVEETRSGCRTIPNKPPSKRLPGTEYGNPNCPLIPQQVRHTQVSGTARLKAVHKVRHMSCTALTIFATDGTHKCVQYGAQLQRAELCYRIITLQKTETLT